MGWALVNYSTSSPLTALAPYPISFFLAPLPPFVLSRPLPTILRSLARPPPRLCATAQVGEQERERRLQEYKRDRDDLESVMAAERHRQAQELQVRRAERRGGCNP